MTEQAIARLLVLGPAAFISLSSVANYGLDAMVRRSEAVLTQLISGRPAEEIAREFA